MVKGGRPINKWRIVLLEEIASAKNKLANSRNRRKSNVKGARKGMVADKSKAVGRGWLNKALSLC